MSTTPFLSVVYGVILNSEDILVQDGVTWGCSGKHVYEDRPKYCPQCGLPCRSLVGMKPTPLAIRILTLMGFPKEADFYEAMAYVESTLISVTEGVWFVGPPYGIRKVALGIRVPAFRNGGHMWSSDSAAEKNLQRAARFVESLGVSSGTCGLHVTRWDEA